MPYIRSFQINHLWSNQNIHWDDIHPDVNILVGINGSFKTTLLRLMYEYFSGISTFQKKAQCDIQSNPSLLDKDISLVYLDSIDVPARNKRLNASALMQELNHVVFQNQEGNSFFNYRMRMLDMPDEKGKIEKRLNQLYGIINNLFEDTGKRVTLNQGSLGFIDKSDNIISLEQLSAGEKQLLLILMKVFLLDEKPAVVFMDEPELALHIRWQRQLIDTMIALNPKAQFIITTHSPSVFSQGWGDKAVYMDQLIR